MIRHITYALFLCFITLSACKKQEDPGYSETEYTGLKTISLYKDYIQNGSSFATNVTWSLLYDGKKLLGADPDINIGRLGNIRLTYDLFDRPIEVRHMAKNTKGDTLLLVQFKIIYNNKNRIDAISVYRYPDRADTPYVFLYNNEQLNSLSKGYYAADRQIHCDSTNNVTVDEAGNVTGLTANDSALTYTIGDAPNTLHASTSVWLLQQIVEGTFEVTNYPLFINKKLPTAINFKASNTRHYDCYYQMDANGNIVHRIRSQFGYTPSANDTTSYTYY